jgi:surface antigen
MADAAKCPSGNGLYCGDSGKGQNTGYLYQCTNGSYSLKSACNNGCQRNSAGKNDSCKASSSPIPVSASSTVGSVSGKLHKNSASGAALSEVQATCNGKSDKTDDKGEFKIKDVKVGNQTISFTKQGYQSFQTTVLIAAGKNANMGNRWLTEIITATEKCPSGNGLYCGDSGKGQNTGYLYQCINGSYSLKSACNNGCQKNASGKDDSCKASPNPIPIPVSVSPTVGSVSGKVHKNSASGAALSEIQVTCNGKSDKTDDKGEFKIKDVKVGNQTILFSKQGYQSFQTTVLIVAGKNANMGNRWLTEIITATAKCPSGNGLYCGDSGKGQNTGYLYQCTNGSFSLKSACNNGCQKNAAGKNDSCKAMTGGTDTTSGNARATTNYPYRNDSITNCTSTCYADEWGFCKKNCTSYVAWRINVTRGNKSFTNTMNGGKWGNAYNWDDNASKLGVTVNNTPSVGAIAQWNEKEVAGGYGHIAYVEKINSDGTANVSEYNFSNKCGYGERNTRAPRYIHINSFINTGVSVSQSVGSVSGIIHKNSASGTTLSDVSVKCGGMSGTTDKDTGKFKLQGIAVGDQTISFSKSGYETYQTTLKIVSGKTANMKDRWLKEITPQSQKLGASTVNSNLDNEKPRILSFGPIKSSINQGETVEISYTVSDSGGSGLRQVELWKGKDRGNLSHYSTDRINGNGPVTGKFKDSPTPAGTYYYGIHVLDNKDNLAYDTGALPVVVIGESPSVGSVSGRLHKDSASGAALSGVEVKCGGRSGTTNNKGAFKLRGIKSGDQPLIFSKAGYESYPTTVSIKAGYNANMGDRWLTEKAFSQPSTAYSMATFPSCKGIKDNHCASAKAGDRFQCTTYVQKNAGWSVGRLGTSLSEKRNRINCKKPKIGAPGSVVVMSLGSYGHVGLVVKVNNGNITIADRNLCCDGKDRQYDVPVNDSRILGFIVSNDQHCLSPGSSQD